MAASPSSHDITPAFRAGDGPPLVLLHGLHASWRVWTPVLPHLTDRFDVLAPTLPGHRGAPTRPDVASVRGITDELERYLDDAGIDTAHVAGNSLGGWVALELARRGRARSVVGFSPAGCWARDKDHARIARLMRTARKTADNTTLHKLTRSARVRQLALLPTSTHGERLTAEEMAGVWEDLKACDALEDILDGIEAEGHLDGSVVPSEVPVRIAWPVRDLTIPYKRYGAPLIAGLPHAELVWLRGVGHVPMHDDPWLVGVTIRDFVATILHQGALPTPTPTRSAG